MKETYYFQHDYSASADPKILGLMTEYTGIAYAIYFNIVERLHQETTHKLPLKKYIYSSISTSMVINDPGLVEKVILSCINDYDLFIEEDGYFYSERVMANFEKRAEISEKNSKAGRKGGLASAKARQKLAKTEPNEATAKRPLNHKDTALSESKRSLENAEADLSESKQRKGKEIKEKEIKSNIIKKEIPTFSMIYKKFPKSKLGEELKDKATWERFSDEDKLMAYELADIYLERNAEEPERREYMPVLGYYLSQTRFNYISGITDKYREQRKAEKELTRRQTDGEYTLKNPDEARMVLKYIRENLPIVSSMKYQMNLAGADKLCFDYGYEKVIEKLMAMEGWEPIKDKDSVVNVCRQWLAKGYGILVGGKDPKKVLEMQNMMSN